MEASGAGPSDPGATQSGIAGRIAERGLNLRPAEHVLYEGRPSWRALMSFYASGIVAALIIGLIVWLIGEHTIAVLVAAVLIVGTILLGWIRRLFTTYLITNERLRIARGVLNKRVQETRLDRVQNVNYQQSLFDRFVRVGNVDFDTAGRDDSEFRFEWVNGQEQVVRAVDAAMAERQRRSPLG